MYACRRQRSQWPGQPGLQLSREVRIAELQREAGVRERLEPGEPLGCTRRRGSAEDTDRSNNGRIDGEDRRGPVDGVQLVRE